MTKQTVNVNIIVGSAKPVVHMSQYDHDAGALVFNIYDGDTEFSIPPDATIIMQGTKPDKQFFLYQCDGFSGNTVTCSVHDQMTAVAGNVECELRIYSDGNGIGTANFTLSIEHAAVADDSITSADTLTALSEIENTIIASRDSAASSASAAKSAAQAANDALSEIENTVTIKTVKVNGTALTPDSSKAVNVTVPTLANNATTTAGGMALDARMGKTLADQASQLAQNTAQIETAGTATSAHSAGEYVMISNALYKVTASVAKGDTWTIGTNVTAANIGSEISSLKSDLANKLYPVGSIYMSVNATNPAELFGGTWEQIKGRFLVGTGANDANTSDWWGHEDANRYNIPAGELGGIASHSHTLSSNGAACIGNFSTVTAFSTGGSYKWKDYYNSSPDSNMFAFMHDPDNAFTSSTDYYNSGSFVGLTGSTDTTNSMPPYLAVYMWKRTA